MAQGFDPGMDLGCWMLWHGLRIGPTTMAGDWIKMRIDLSDDPAVARISRLTGLDVDSVIGKLHRLWGWADRHTDDGQAEGVDEPWIDKYIGKKGFASAMISVRWLEISGEKVSFPSFDKHNGTSAKKRCNDLERQRQSRKTKKPVTKSCDTSVTPVTNPCDKSVTREEKRREESVLGEVSRFREPDIDLVRIPDSWEVKSTEVRAALRAWVEYTRQRTGDYLTDLELASLVYSNKHWDVDTFTRSVHFSIGAKWNTVNEKRLDPPSNRQRSGTTARRPQLAPGIPDDE